ncbi:disease resistance protein RPV1-like [Bidens hawaiensis]|uniref:disease resistance protein RPV1-like n=1 Tax=Bidens hawaiensis TaxID=980011 RepID=UPI00404A0983
MASSSSSSIERSFKYDVFLSYKNEDLIFVNNLYDALKKSGICTYKDDERIEKGKKISDELIRSIEESRFYIIVLSKNYACSSWCLDELVKIMECQKTKEKTAYPVFYDLEPTEVRHQGGAVGKAFVKLEYEEAAGRWRDALKKASILDGWVWKTTVNGHQEARFIQKIVETVFLQPHFINRSVNKDLVGMVTRVKNLVKSLETGCDDVRMIGIVGKGGGGKATLARAVFDHISIWFEGKSFVKNVREASKRYGGLEELQKQIIKDVLYDQSIVITDVYEGKAKMKHMMHSRKVLLVLHDVDDRVQLEALAGRLTWFKPGSRIIITARDSEVLIEIGVNFIHDVELLFGEEAICLFNSYAFGGKIPVQGYAMLSRTVVFYCAGLPSTLKILGSHLCGRSKPEWVDAIERLKTIPLNETLVISELGYHGLENEEKEMFLDVVCILKGEKKKKTIRILLSCGFNARIVLRILEQKSLITFDKDRVLFHDHIEQMGRNIVRCVHPGEPSKSSWLWIKKEIEDILVNKWGTNITRSIKLEGSGLHPAIIMKGLRKMTELIFLHVDNGYSNWEIDNNSSGTEITRSIKREASNLHPSVVMKGLRKRKKLIFPHVHNRYRNWEIDNSGLYLPNTLRCLHWHHYPFWSLPNTFQANDLVNLEMVRSNITQLWEEGERKILNKLRFLNFSGSKLTRLDLGMTPNLEELNLRKCNDFKELHVSAECRNLNVLILGCPKLTDLNLELIPNLEELHLEECNELIELHMPVQPPKLTLSAKKIKRLPESICMLKHLKFLELESCLLLELLPEDLHRLECLEELYLTNCVSLRDIPSSICKMKCLKYLHLPYCILVKELPEELGSLKCLKELNIEGSGIRHLLNVETSTCSSSVVLS